MAESHPEDVCLASAGPRDITMYSGRGCHLCDEAKTAIAPLLNEFGVTLREVTVNDDPVLSERYGHEVPVIFIGQHKAAKIRVDIDQFRRQLQARSQPVSR